MNATKYKNYITESNEWTFDLLNKFTNEIEKIANEFGLETFPNQIEVISAQQMMDAYASTGMPLIYPHWSFGKQFLNIEKLYKRGSMGLAYEIVINSNPCISYLMEENTMAMQALVIAHAAFGHNSFFKNNYLFKTWTSPDSIIDYLVFAKKYILECEEQHGIEPVEDIIDACHSIMNFGVDKYKRPPALSLQEEKDRQTKREAHIQQNINDLWRTIPTSTKHIQQSSEIIFPSEPQENLLYFIEKNAPLLEPWQREIVRIVRKIAQYFYPQRQTKIMNEGWATFWHYTLINKLYDDGKINDQFMMEVLHSHTNVIYQPAFSEPAYTGLNPYSLGFAIYTDIKRICEFPTAEDKKYFPDIAGSNWQKTLRFAMENFKDESFIAQFLSHKVIRDLKLFTVLNDDQRDEYEITDIHDEIGYKHIRETLAHSYNISNTEPDIQIFRVDTRNTRSMTLRYTQLNRKPLDTCEDEVLKHLYRLWGFPINLETVDSQQIVINTKTIP